MTEHVTGLLILLALGGVVYYIAVVLAIGWRLRHPPRRTCASAIARNLPSDPGELIPPPNYDSWSFASRGHDLPVWDIQGLDPDGPTVVLTHGWGDSRIGALTRVPHLLPFASRIIAWDLPGHGESPGVSSLGVHEPKDLLALLNQLDDRRVVLYGSSLGAVVSIAAAGTSTHPQLAAVIAEAPYQYPETPARNVLRAASLPSGLTLTGALWTLGLTGKGRIAFDCATHAQQLTCPLFVIHGELDRVSPIEDGRCIARAAPLGSFCSIEQGNHNHLWTDTDMLETTRNRVHAFLDELPNYHCSDDNPPEQSDG